MRVVWKFPMCAPTLRVTVGDDAKVVHIGIDPASGELPVVWIEHDSDALTDAVTFVAVATGEDVPPGYEHQGTVIVPAGLVWHIYRVD